MNSFVCTSKKPPFKAEPGFEDFRKADYERRRAILKKSAKSVEISSEYELCRREQAIAERKIVNDKQLCGYWTLHPLIDKEKLGRIFRYLGQRSVISQGRESQLLNDKGPKYGEIPKNLITYQTKYWAPKQRIKITSNITFNKWDVIPVYSDLENETVKNIEIPNSLLFDYIDVNSFDASLETELAEAVTMSEKTNNLIRCDCSSREPIVHCYENEKCPCYNMNKQLQTLQIVREDCPYTEFASFKPIIFTEPRNLFTRCMGFACSEICACKGCCTNNSLLIPKKKLFPTELYRKNKEIGFEVRSSVLIPAGTPILEFVGEIVEKRNFNVFSIDYAYELVGVENGKWLEIVDSTKFDENYKTLLKKFSTISYTYYIDPKSEGNIGRMFCHSCSPNMEVVRVFQKSLSPAHIHLMVISILDIYPGIPLTIDYGAEYTAKQMGGKCLCGSFACLSTKNSEYSAMLFSNFTKCHTDLYNWQKKDWVDNVLKVKRRFEEQCKLAGREPKSSRICSD